MSYIKMTYGQHPNLTCFIPSPPISPHFSFLFSDLQGHSHIVESPSRSQYIQASSLNPQKQRKNHSFDSYSISKSQNRTRNRNSLDLEALGSQDPSNTLYNIQKEISQTNGKASSTQFGYPSMKSKQTKEPKHDPFAQALGQGGAFGVDPQFINYRPHEEEAKPQAATDTFSVKEEVRNNPSQQKTLLVPERGEEKKKNKGWRRPTDDDYEPTAAKGANRPKVLHQRESRNMIPNSVHHIWVYIQRQFKSGAMTRRIFARSCPEESYTPARYYLFQRLLKTSINNYINLSTLKLMLSPDRLHSEQFSFEQQAYYCYVARILVHYFLKAQSATMVLRSRKVKRENRAEHLKVQRYLYEDLVAHQAALP